jgi:hypothetical protein
VSKTTPSTIIESLLAITLFPININKGAAIHYKTGEFHFLKTG